MTNLLIPLCICNLNLDLLRTWKAVCWVESRGDPRAVNLAESAVGIAQIRRIMVDDCNRIAGRCKWTYNDRLAPAKSLEMFRTYSLHYWPTGGPEQWARGWNGGPRGPEKAATAVYWSKVQAHLDD